MSERRACSAVEISRTAYRYAPFDRADGPIIDALSELAEKHSDLGFGKFYWMLRQAGHGWNHKRIYRVYCGMKLNKRRKFKRRVRRGTRIRSRFQRERTRAGRRTSCRMP